MYFTDKEKIENSGYFSFIAGRKSSDMNFLEMLGDLYPGIIHINHKSDFRLLYLNKRGYEFFAVDPEYIMNKPAEIIVELSHPDYLLRSRQKIRDFERKNDIDSVLPFLQWIRPINKTEFVEHLSFRKILNDHSSITFTHNIKYLENISGYLNGIRIPGSPIISEFKKFQSLTHREKEILRLISLGYKNSEISDRLFISKTTVQTHRRNIKRKLDFPTTAELVRFEQKFR